MAGQDEDVPPGDRGDTNIPLIKLLLGRMAFKRPDFTPRLWPMGLSAGTAALQRLRQGALPSDIIGEFVGRRTQDIELKPQK